MVDQQTGDQQRPQQRPDSPAAMKSLHRPAAHPQRAVNVDGAIGEAGGEAPEDGSGDDHRPGAEAHQRKARRIEEDPGDQRPAQADPVKNAAQGEVDNEEANCRVNEQHSQRRERLVELGTHRRPGDPKRSVEDAEDDEGAEAQSSPCGSGVSGRGRQLNGRRRRRSGRRGRAKGWTEEERTYRCVTTTGRAP